MDHDLAARDRSPGARRGDRIEAPLDLLLHVARRLAAAAEPVRQARRPAAAPDAGPASEVVAGLLADVDAAMEGLATSLAAAAGGIRETAEDLAETDARVAQLFERAPVPVASIGPAS